MLKDHDWADLSAYLDGELTAAARARVEQLLATDKEARQALQVLERTQSLIATTMGDVDLTARVQARVSEMKAGGTGDGQRFVLPALGVAAALIVVVAVGLSFLGGPSTPIVEPALPVADAPAPPAAPDVSPEMAEPARPSPAAPRVSPAAPAPDAVMASIEPPVADFDRLPEARAPYALLAVDAGEVPALAYVELARNKRVVAVPAGEALPDNRVLAWGGAEGIILGAAGDWHRMAAPLDEYETLAGIWEVEVWIDGVVEVPATVVRIEEDNGGFRIPMAPVLDSGIRGERIGTRLEVTIDRLNRPIGQRVLINLSGSSVRGHMEFEMTGTAAVVSEDASGSQVEESHSCVVRARRLSHLERARFQHLQSLHEHGIDLVEQVRQELIAFHAREERLPRDTVELLDALERRAGPLRAQIEGRLVYYEPVAFVLESHMPVAAEAVGNPDLLYQYEMDAIARHGSEAPLPTPLLEMELPEIEERLGVGMRPFASSLSAALFHWHYRTRTPQREGEWESINAQSQNNLKQLGLVIKMFENEHGDYTPGGWWSVYPEYLSDLGVLTHPLDPPGTLSYDYLVPATNIRQVLEDLHGEEALEPPGALHVLMAQYPMAVEAQAYGQPPGRNVLFADGHVEWMPERDYQQRSREWFGR